VEKTRTGVRTTCKDHEALPRARPLTLAEVLAPERSTVVLQSDFEGWPQFVGPAGVRLAEAEHSFGQLYAPTLEEMLRADLGEDWEQLTARPSSQDAKEEQDAAAAAIEADLALWAQENWVWSFLTKPESKGNVSYAAWRHNRAQACNASMETYLAGEPAELTEGVRRVALCAPAPTGDLSILCKEMTQFAKDVAQANCQLVGRGDCIANLGMFYLPYMWSATNQVHAGGLARGGLQVELEALLEVWREAGLEVKPGVWLEAGLEVMPRV
jgi:hypothetical protein